jgi:hypothetical protein
LTEILRKANKMTKEEHERELGILYTAAQKQENIQFRQAVDITQPQ